LREKRISAVLHHDLNADMRSACRIVMQAHRVLPQGPPPPPSQVQVITPFNLPGARGRETSPA
jgi:LacI family transcriptional regulator